MIWQAVLSALMKPVLAVAALVASWFGGRKAAQTDAKVDDLEDKLFESMRAKEIESDVEALSRDALRERSRVWVRGNHDR